MVKGWKVAVFAGALAVGSFFSNYLLNKERYVDVHPDSKEMNVTYSGLPDISRGDVDLEKIAIFENELVKMYENSLDTGKLADEDERRLELINNIERLIPPEYNLEVRRGFPTGDFMKDILFNYYSWFDDAKMISVPIKDDLNFSQLEDFLSAEGVGGDIAMDYRGLMFSNKENGYLLDKKSLEASIAEQFREGSERAKKGLSPEQLGMDAAFSGIEYYFIHEHSPILKKGVNDLKDYVFVSESGIIYLPDIDGDGKVSFLGKDYFTDNDLFKRPSIKSDGGPEIIDKKEDLEEDKEKGIFKRIFSRGDVRTTDELKHPISKKYKLDFDIDPGLLLEEIDRERLYSLEMNLVKTMNRAGPSNELFFSYAMATEPMLPMKYSLRWGFRNRFLRKNKLFIDVVKPFEDMDVKEVSVRDSLIFPLDEVLSAYIFEMNDERKPSMSFEEYERRFYELNRENLLISDDNYVYMVDFSKNDISFSSYGPLHRKHVFQSDKLGEKDFRKLLVSGDRIYVPDLDGDGKVYGFSIDNPEFYRASSQEDIIKLEEIKTLDNFVFIEESKSTSKARRMNAGYYSLILLCGGIAFGLYSMTQ